MTARFRIIGNGPGGSEENPHHCFSIGTIVRATPATGDCAGLLDCYADSLGQYVAPCNLEPLDDAGARMLAEIAEVNK